MIGGGALLSDDGTKFWMVAKNKGTNSDEAHIYAWTLSTPFRVDTAAAVGSTAIKVITEMSNITALLFNNDGTKIVCANGSNFYQFDLSTAYDLSTMGSGTESNWRIDLGRDPLYIDWSGSGDKLITTEAWGSGGHSTRVRVFDLNTPYDITAMANLPVGTTTSFDQSNPYYSIYSSNIYQKGWKISQDGLKFYAIDAANGKTLTKELPSAWVMKTGSVTTGDQYGLGDGNNWTTVAEDDYDLITGNYYNVSWTQNGSAIILFNGPIAPNYLDIISLPATQVFPSTDVGKKVVGNSGSAIITSTSGTYTSVTPFADTSAISSWQLFGAEGKADGSGIQLTHISGGYDFSSLSYTGRSFYLTGAVATLVQAEGMSMKPDGTKMWVAGKYLDQLVEFSLSTPYEIDTASSTGTTLDISSYESAVKGVHVNSEGTRLIIIGSNQDEWNEFHLSTGWDLTTATHDQVRSIADLTTGVGAPQDLVFNDDGTRLFICDDTTDNIFGYTLSTAFDISGSSLTSAGSLSIASIETSPGSLSINNDGTELYISGSQNDNLQMLKLDTAYDLSSYNASASLTYSWVSDGSGIGTTPIEGITISKSGSKLYLTSNSEYIYEYDFGAPGASNFNSYSPALTNSSTGQINSSSWVDLDSMTADETKNDGDVFYAVSTDDRTSWGVIKDGDGVRKIAKNNSGTWQYNNDGGAPSVITNNISLIGDANTNSGSYNSISGQQTPGGNTVHKPNWISPDGTKLYVMNNESGTSSSNYTNSKVWEYSMSTAYDLSTASATGATENINFWDGQSPHAIAFNPEGTKLWITGGTTNSYTYRFNLSTAWDLSTSVQVDGSENNNNNSRAGRLLNSGTVGTLKFNSDGSKVYSSNNATTIFRYSTSSAYHINGDLTSDQSVDLSTLGSGLSANLGSWEFNSNGTKLYAIDLRIDEPGIFVFNLSTAYDLSTLTYDATVSVASYGWEGSADTWMHGIHIRDNDQRLYLWFGEYGGSYIHSLERKWTEWTIGNSEFIYSTSETWVNGTNNNEHATLQEALGAQSFNRMNKAQLQAVTDPNHYVLGDTLDLMIAPYAASGTSPISDGVTIGYQASALIKQAIPGTDYEAYFPSSNSVSITSLAAQNLKVRII